MSGSFTQQEKPSGSPLSIVEDTVSVALNAGAMCLNHSEQFNIIHLECLTDKGLMQEKSFFFPKTNNLFRMKLDVNGPIYTIIIFQELAVIR